MKDYNSQLKIQAYLDGELTGAQARQVEEWLASDPDAKLLHAELQATRATIRANEPEAKLPVPHEFYWNQIRRAIEQADPSETTAESAPRPWLSLLGRYLVPVSGFALLCLLGLVIFKFTAEDPARHYVEIINYSEDMNVSSFRAQSEKMFVVWLSPKEVSEEFDGEEAYQ